MSKPWSRKKAPSRADVERQLRRFEETTGVDLICFVKSCGKPAVGIDECITCEKLGRQTRILSCPKHRANGIAMIKKHALVKHPANLLRVVAAGLKGEEI